MGLIPSPEEQCPTKVLSKRARLTYPSGIPTYVWTIFYNIYYFR
jgi:hypothetical protein